MSKTGASDLDRRRTASLAAALVLSAALLMFGLVTLGGRGGSQPVAVAAGGDLTVTWADDGSRVTVAGAGFRANSTVTARVGDLATAVAEAAADGSVRIEVAVDPDAAGSQGTSVLLSGRSRNGSARTVVSAAPPRAAGHGPVDLAPWSLVAALLVVAAATVRDRWLVSAAKPTARAE